MVSAPDMRQFIAVVVSLLLTASHSLAAAHQPGNRQFVSPNQATEPAKDWRKSGCIGPIQNEGECSSSTQMGVADVLAAQHCIDNGGPFTALSYQELLECPPGSMGCNGAMLDVLFRYTIKEGLDTAAAYPPKPTPGSCHHTASGAVHAKSWIHIPPTNESRIIEVLENHGPVIVAIDANSPAFEEYTSGVFPARDCGKELDHVLVLVGYGYTSSGEQYYIAGNFWGTSWGMDGYIELQAGQNACGVASSAWYVNTK